MPRREQAALACRLLLYALMGVMIAMIVVAADVRPREPLTWGREVRPCEPYIPPGLLDD